MRRGRFGIIILLCVLTACAEPPPVNYDIIRAQDIDDPLGHLDLLRRQDEQIAGTKFVNGNAVKLYRVGPVIYRAMLNAIHNAHKRIDMESYQFDDGAGRQFAAALLDRRKAGVDVNLIYDSWGSSDTPTAFFDRLRAKGIHVLEFNPADAESIVDLSINDRDHRKVLVIDGKIAFTGGVNISKVYERKLHHGVSFDKDDIAYDHLPWRDTDIRVEGPVVAEFEHVFMETWHQQKGEPIPSPPPTPAAHKGNLSVQVVEETPGKDRYSIYKSLLVAIALAQSSIHLTTGFFVPTPDLVEGLEQAAERGVDVVLILPSESDSDFALKAGRGYYQELMEAGVHIYERQGAVLHAKTAVIDGEWSMIGSANLDWRSAIFNDECDAIILGKDFGDQMETMFNDDLLRSRRIDYKRWVNRSFWEAVDEWKSRLLEEFL